MFVLDRLVVTAGKASIFLCLLTVPAATAGAVSDLSVNLDFNARLSRSWTLVEGDALELSVRIDRPSELPPNARIEAAWDGPASSRPAYDGDRSGPGVEAATGWNKVLHALDPDIHVVYRAPRSGSYTLRLETVTDRPQPLGPIPHDTGLAPLATPLPANTPAVSGVAVSVDLSAVGSLASGSLVLEAEPNNAPEQATNLSFPDGEGDQVLYVIGGTDEIEYYQNSETETTPDDWYRIEYRGAEARFLSANLQIVEPVVSARIRCYKEGLPSEEELSERKVPNSYDFANFNPIPYVHPPAVVVPGPVPVYTYEEGRALNERAHQQDRSFRTFVTRRVEPGQTYYLRVEANQPHYEMQVRLFDPAPYDDPVDAVRQGIYYHLAEIDAWLIHRPRNIALHRRVRDATALFGENCMSCHTQSGVWGVADAFRMGYRPEGVEQNYRRLVNTMYESLRLTNKLKDAAVNTSVAPNDLGDGPAGTRVAGRNIVLHERTFRPKKAHVQWQQRTANYVLQTADPKGINAAGRGSNFGPNVVFKFTAEILERAWRDTGEPRYFFGLEEKGRKILATGDNVRVTDDYGHRVEFFHRVWPHDYVERVRELTNSPRRVAEAERLHGQLRDRAETDVRRLLALQREDGGWGFNAGRPDGNGGWARPDDHSYPAATAVALIALEAAGRDASDPAAARGVQWLLRNQYPYGLWNAAAATGFVTSAYAIRALSRLHPVPPEPLEAEIRLDSADSPLEALAKVRAAQATGEAKYVPLFREAVRSAHAKVRLYGLLGLGAVLASDSASILVDHLDDPVKACREAAFWSLRQLLLDGAGWNEILAAYRHGSDRTRQSVMQALVTRAHLLDAGFDVDLSKLSGTLTAGMVDPHPGVRAFAFKAAWHWWVWNPPMREPLNRAWIDALLRDEPEANVDMALRYSTISLFVVNGQVNNITGGKYLDQQYPELAALYAELAAWRESAPEGRRRVLDRRLTAMAASHYMERANQQSPGQFAYSTPGATELFGKAVLAVYNDGIDKGIPWRSIALEGARNIVHKPLQDTLLDLLMTSDPAVVAIAARGLANPGELSIPARPDALEPLLRVLREFSSDGREKDAEALASFLARVRWDFEGVSEEGEAAFYDLLLGRVEAGQAILQGAGALVLGKPAPSSIDGLEEDPVAPFVARILGENRTLHRKRAFKHLSSDPRLWLDSTEWMLAFREGQETPEEAVEGAVEAEDLRIAELTFGRTTEQMIPGGVASNNSVLIWEEGKVGAHITFALDVPADGRYELLGAFLYGASHGIVEIEFDGGTVLEQTDFYRPEVTSTGPMSLGAFELSEGPGLFTVTMIGSNDEAEPEFKFGLDYLKLAPRGDSEPGAALESAGDKVDPIAAAKAEVVAMFVRWFSPSTPGEIRELAARLASSPALRRHPEVRKAIAAHVENEPIAKIRTRLELVLANDDARYGAELRDLVANARSDGVDSRGPRIEPTQEFIADILHFRDYVFAEMTKVSERDGRACISCHGVPGRVPTLYLHPPDGAGYIGAKELLENYRKLQARVDSADPERSLVLRKPLNVQTGQEEGHQGGLRYEPGDEGFLVLHDWVLKQSALQAPAETP